MTAARRLIRRALMLTAALCGLGVAAIAAMFAIAAVDRRDSFTLSHAALADASFLAHPVPPGYALPDDALAVHAHRLAQGTGTVFGDRFYSNGSVFAVDDEVYEKLTVWIPQDLPARPLSLDLGKPGGAVAVYTRGGSAWPRLGCAGIVQGGRVTIEPVRGALGGARWRVHVVGELQLREDPAELMRCSTGLDRQFDGAALDFARLTPWLGAAGAHPYDETYR